MPDLGSTLSLNSSNFGAGIAEARAKLTELNTALIENRNKMKEVNKEASELQKQEKALAESMKGGGTKEQQEEMQKLRDRIGQVNAELGTLKTREREIQSDIRKASNELDNQKNGMNNLANAGDNATNAVKRLETGLKSVITMAAGKKLFDYFIGSNAEMEQYTTSFEVMLGDMEKAQSLMGELTDMAAVTPMEITDIVPIGTLLMNYGVAADELVDKMTQLGDLSQGNATKFQRVATAYGQMLAKGKVTGEELRQMTEAGVPLLQALADTLGVTTAEVQDMISKSQVGIDALDAAITSMTTGTGQFAGMMEKQSQTFSGMLSTLKDNIAQFGRDAGEDAFLVVKQSLAELMAMLDEWREDGTLEKIAYELGETVEGVINILKGAIGFIWNTKEGILALAVAMGTFKAAINIGNLINATVTAIRSYKNAVDAAKVSQIAFNAVGAANPFVLIVSLAASAIGALITFGMTAHDAGENVKQFRGRLSKPYGVQAAFLLSAMRFRTAHGLSLLKSSILTKRRMKMIVNGIDLSFLLAVIGALTLCTNVVTEVLKKSLKNFPAQITAFIVAMALTVAAFFAYAAVAEIAVEWYMVAGAVVAGFFVSYGAQFGFDKLKEVIEKFKEVK